ncbi:MAG: translation initiation factor IF-2 subunit alpha [Euryarchaeota archaeon]|nr:translation initiation factor IF-2 subunit alpha [Euryarchaeota archaeon]
MKKGWPDVGDLVVCTVVNVVEFGAFVQLDEYDKKEGLIHISEVASGWVKYIRDHVREGQKIVCKVLNVDPSRSHIDLSFKDVNEHQRRAKIQEWKSEQKAQKWLEFVADATDENRDVLYDQLTSKFGSLYYLFEEAALRGLEALPGIEHEVATQIVKVARENVKAPYVFVTGYVDLTCPRPNGIDIIKRALKSASKSDDDDIRFDVSYVGAPRYRIRIVALDYKKAESALKKAANNAIDVVMKADGTGKFYRELHSP